MIVADYEFSAEARDVALLRRCAAVAAAAHAPFIAAASPRFFGAYDRYPSVSWWGLDAGLEGPDREAWRLFRDGDSSRYVGLTLPRLRLRGAYRDPPRRVAGAPEDTAGADVFAYSEHVPGYEQGVWGTCALAFATRVADSFARYRWCPNIVGYDGGGRVDNLCAEKSEVAGRPVLLSPFETPLGDELERRLAEAGFIPLCSDCGAVFRTANSCHRPGEPSYVTRVHPDGGETRHRLPHLDVELPYLFVACRFAHYLKVIYRENHHRRTRRDVERELGAWLSRHAYDAFVVHPKDRARRIVRSLQWSLTEDPSGRGHAFTLRVHPGMGFGLSGGAKVEIAGRL